MSSKKLYDTRKIVEKTNYFKKAKISNIKLGNVIFDKSGAFLIFYIFLLFVFLWLLYLENGDIKLTLKVPFFYIGIVLFLVGLYLISKGKATLKGVKPIYEIISNFFSIIKDNSLKKYNKKNELCNNELKSTKIGLN